MILHIDDKKHVKF